MIKIMYLTNKIKFKKLKELKMSRQKIIKKISRSK